MNERRVHADLIPARRYPGLAADWTALEQCATGSPFLSWLWVSTWLQLLPPHIEPVVFRACDDDGLLALGLLVEQPQRGPARLVWRRSLHLQGTGDKDIDEITIEYAGLLARDGGERAAYASFLSTLAAGRRDWRRLRIPATEHGPVIDAVLPRGLRATSVLGQPSHYVDLAGLRASGTPYLHALRKKTRASLGRIRRAYERHGPLRVEVASDGPQALEWLAGLRALHQRRWAGRNLEGAFTSAFFEAFHARLVAAGTPAGFTRITRVSAGDLVVGYLYNLEWRGTLYFYNSGLDYGLLDQYDSPGMVSLLALIERALAGGYQAVDFLAGEQDYKRRLATASRTLHWIDVRPRGPRMAAERLAAAVLGKTAALGQPIARTLVEAADADHDGVPACPPAMLR